MQRPNRYYAYIAADPAKTVFYSGATSDIVRRMLEHKTKKIAGRLEQKVTELLVFEVYDNPYQALLARKRMQDWIKGQNIRVIQSFNPWLRDLTEQIVAAAH